MPKAIRSILLSIVPILFVGMMASLVWRDQSAESGISYLSARGTIVDPVIGTTWYAIRRSGELIGYARTTIGYAGEQEERYSSVEETAVEIDGFGDGVYLTMHMESEMDNAMTPLTLEGTVGIGSISFDVTSVREGTVMQVTLAGMGTEIARTLEFRGDLATASSAYAIAVSRAGRAGEQFRFQTFDAFSQSEAPLTLTFRGNGTLQTAGEVIETRHFTVEKSSLTSEVYLDTKGRMLREESSSYVSEITDFAEIRELYEAHHGADQEE